MELTSAPVDTGNTAWVLGSAALVLLMTPGLALFYGGMVRLKSVLNMMMMSLGAMGTVGVVWVLWGYSETFGESVHGLVGDPLQHAGLGDLLGPGQVVGGVPVLAFAGFQGAFAVIAVALVSGAIADRARFGTWLLFTVLWATLVYFPVAHWVFALDGLAAPHGGWVANRLHALDFAGGTAVHVNAGAAALALALVLGRRLGFRAEPMHPHNPTMVVTGTALLWFGWFGFNAGSALGAGDTAALAWVDTFVAPAAAALGWLLLDRLRGRRPSSIGAASGVVSGLVAITPAADAVTPLGAVLLGLLAGVVCSAAVSLKHRFGVDDSLDVVGVHLVGGLLGTVAIGVLAAPSTPAGVAGLAYGGGAGQLARQAAAAFTVAAVSFAATWLIGTALERTVGFRVPGRVEHEGIDRHEHDETAYGWTPWRVPRGRGEAAGQLTLTGVHEPV
ncbi:MAG TPA: ammonium transporter [Segeticoccus sp.]|uniref:ammonium transporter n=1 Tax=Segeticoccus sp. TaxID=2706531 RepID=UPI002D7FAC2D|nr:ammonium transporter [Segeticoccus sp.]HET8601565.1 ammonium transporter [Segeticoccus sp.]